MHLTTTFTRCNLFAHNTRPLAYLAGVIDSDDDVAITRLDRAFFHAERGQFYDFTRETRMTIFFAMKLLETAERIIRISCNHYGVRKFAETLVCSPKERSLEGRVKKID